MMKLLVLEKVELVVQAKVSKTNNHTIDIYGMVLLLLGDKTMHIFFYLLLGHFLADYPLQSDFLANMKGKNNFLLLCHVMIYSLIIAAILDFGNMFTLWKLAFLILTHFATDYWKCHYGDKNLALTLDLWIDQLLHFGVLLIVSIK